MVYPFYLVKSQDFLSPSWPFYKGGELQYGSRTRTQWGHMAKDPAIFERIKKVESISSEQ